MTAPQAKIRSLEKRGHFDWTLAKMEKFLEGWQEVDQHNFTRKERSDEEKCPEIVPFRQGKEGREDQSALERQTGGR